MFVLASDKVLSGRYSTLYTLMLNKKSGLPAKVVMRAPKGLQPLAYMAMHLLLCSFASLTSVRAASQVAAELERGPAAWRASTRLLHPGLQRPAQLVRWPAAGLQPAAASALQGRPALRGAAAVVPQLLGAHAVPGSLRQQLGRQRRQLHL